MNSEQLDKALKKRTKEAKRKRIWQRAYKIAETFGKKTVREGNDHTTVSYDFELGQVSIYKSTYTYGGDHISIGTQKEGQVFDASETDLHSLERETEGFSRAFQLKQQGLLKGWIRVDGYIPGSWEKILNQKLVRIMINGIKRVEKERMRRASEKSKHKQPLSEAEEQLAESFGLKN